MVLKTEELIKKLANTKTEETLFNPYNQICKHFDINTAPGLRQGNLRVYLDAHLMVQADTLLVFEHADYLSTKMSGVPFLEPNDFEMAQQLLGTTEFFENPVKRFRMNDENSESKKVWETISKQHKRVLLWHLLPFYPHENDDLTTIRTPSDEEYIKYSEFTVFIMQMFSPKNIVAGNKETKRLLKVAGINSVLRTF